MHIFKQVECLRITICKEAEPGDAEGKQEFCNDQEFKVNGLSGTKVARGSLKLIVA